MKEFSELAQKKMMDLFNNHSHEVGSELKKIDPAKYKAYESTDCITYSIKVLSYAFKKRGNTEAEKKVWRLIVVY